MPSLSVSRRRIGIPVLFAAVSGAMALLAPQAGSGSAPVDCREVTCTAPIDKGKRVVKWASPEAFYPNNEQIFADLSTDGGPLELVRSYGAEGCRHRFFGGGISALVKACGDVTSLRVRAVRVKRRALPLRITYSAAAAMDGAPSIPGHGSTRKSPELKPISKPVGQ